MRAGADSFFVYFRRGVYALLTSLCSKGRVVIATHACRSYASIITDFLNRAVAGQSIIECISFKRGTSKFVAGNVQLILDDKPERWTASQAAIATRVPEFRAANASTDIFLYEYMVRQPLMFRDFDPRGLRRFTDARFAKHGPVPVDVYVETLRMFLRANVLPIRCCSHMFCKTYKVDRPHSVCAACALRDSEGTISSV